MMSKGHIIMGLPILFIPRKLTILASLDRQVFDEDFLVRAEIITDFERLEDATNYVKPH